MWTDALIALAFGAFTIFVALPIAAVVLLTLLDICFRQDIGFSRLVWMPIVLFVPVGGLLMYWLLRPKDFDPLTEVREASTYAPSLRYAATYRRPVLTPVPAATPVAPAAPSVETEAPERKAA